MEGLTHFSPLSLSSCPPKHNHFSSKTLLTSLTKPFSWPHLKFSSNSRIGGTTVAFGGNSSSEPNESQFFDKNGVIDDMDGYLNYLSLEYDSVWDTKPSWCQPWTITLTGVSVIAGSWLIFHSVIFTTIISLLICTWWYIFLYSYPKAYSEMIAERKKNVTDGVEDTYGGRKSQ